MNKKGFTLVELIAVVAIITFIGLIVVPEVLDIIKDNRNKGYLEIERRLEEAASKYIVNEYVDSSVDSVIISKEELINNGYIEEVHDLKDNSVCEASIYVYNLNSVAEFNSILSCSSYETKGRNAVWYIKDLYADETTRAENGLTNPKATYEGKEYDTGIRFVGAIDDVKNKVYYNCEDKDENNVSYGEEGYNYAASCEVWRIIGVFDVDNGSGKIEKRVKLVRDALSVRMSFDSSVGGENIENSINYGYGINQWGESTYEDGSTYEGADLMRMLNGYYIGRESTCKYCNNVNQGTCSNDCTSSVTPLSTTSLRMVEDALWERGAQKWIDQMPLSTMYTNERGTATGKICTSSSTYEGKPLCIDIVNRTIDWIGKIGLIYPSDYGYASTDSSCASDIIGENSTCENNNWLHSSSWYWTFSPYASSSTATGVWSVIPSSSVGAGTAYVSIGVRPSLYLSSNLKIISGNGADEPYILGM